MRKLSLNLWARHILKLAMQQVSEEIREEALGNSAVVFSPHQDDETLGCGGTIIRKKGVGAELIIVYMTDGSSSHKRFISKDALKAIRTEEALAANQILGVPEDNIMFLEFEARQLCQHQEAATQRVRDIIHTYRPNEIFIPYYKEAHPDHWVTNSIVLSALQECQHRAYIYEYPVWYWLHWPWVSFSSDQKNLMTVIKNTLDAKLGFQLVRDFQCAVSIVEVLEIKRAALYQYRSQMTRFLPNTRWMTLGDVSDGEFLECFFQEWEVFRRYQPFR
jgi:LmbE family N-acetylglucosaminyl deacetylase